MDLDGDFFHDRRDGFFVDVGANDYHNFSNTYYLETALGWSGLAIEPQREFEPDYHQYRPRSRFLPFFLSDASNETARLFYLTGNSFVTSAVQAFTEEHARGPVFQFEAPTITLDDLLTQERVTHVDFLSIDVELSEPKVLAGFTIERTQPALVCIEAHPPVRQQILDYFMRHQYTVVGKYLRIDTTNLYFMPANAAG